MTKVISISDDAYAYLTKLKEKGESFTDVVVDLATKEMTKPLSSFSGAWVGDREDMERIFEEILKGREKFELRGTMA